MTVIDDYSKKREKPRKSGSHDNLKLASVWILFIGIVSIAIWYFTNDGSMMSMLLLLAAITTITLAVLIYYLSPSKLLRSEVCDAMAVSGTLEIRKLLSSLYIESKGMYVPASIAGSTKVFIPTSGNIDKEMLQITNFNSTDKVFFMPEKGVKGILLSPPGYGIFQYAQRIGAHFATANVANEISDVIENSLELSEKVSIKVDNDQVCVILKNLVNHQMCKSIRREDPAICFQTGCPICSAVGCMIVNGTGKIAYIENIQVDGKTVNLEFRLIGE